MSLQHADGLAEVIDSIDRIGLGAEWVAVMRLKQHSVICNQKPSSVSIYVISCYCPMALGNRGAFHLEATLHTLTHIDLIRTSLDCDITRDGD